MKQFDLLRWSAPFLVIGGVVLGAFTPVVMWLVDPSAALYLGGDFPSFYVAGQIVLEGGISDLYDPLLQQTMQGPYHEGSGEFLYFAYPPFVAIAYASIAWMPYPVAYAVQTAVSLGALASALWMLTGSIAPLGERSKPIVTGIALSLSVYPVASAVLGGQNTTVTLLLILLAFGGTMWRDKEWIAGVAAGLLWYKPQYGLLVAVALGFGRRWATLLWGGVTGFVVYAATAVALGVKWPFEWTDQVQVFAEQNQDVNGHLMVNLVGWWRAAIGGVPAIAIGLVVVLSIVSLWIVAKRSLPVLSVGLVSAWIILASLSSLYYDAGIAFVAVGAVAIASGVHPMVIGAVIVASWVQLLANGLGWSPVFFVVVAAWGHQVYLFTGSRRFPSRSLGTLADSER